MLDHRRVPLSDVGAALQELEPVCAALAASRDDREEAVVQPLERIHEEFVTVVDDLVSFTEVGRRFHEELVAGCGNETLVVVVGALTSLLIRSRPSRGCGIRLRTVSGRLPAVIAATSRDLLVRERD